MKENLKSIYAKLGKVKNTLLKEETGFIELREALEEYKAILLELSGLNLENKENRTDLQLSRARKQFSQQM